MWNLVGPYFPLPVPGPAAPRPLDDDTPAESQDSKTNDELHYSLPIDRRSPFIDFAMARRGRGSSGLKGPNWSRKYDDVLLSQFKDGNLDPEAVDSKLDEYYAELAAGDASYTLWRDVSKKCLVDKFKEKFRLAAKAYLKDAKGKWTLRVCSASVVTLLTATVSRPGGRRRRRVRRKLTGRARGP